MRLSLAALAVIGAAVLLLATGRGIGLMPDSADYFSASENLLAGNGLVVSGAAGTSRPFTLWPPLYPFLLALGGMAGLPLAEASRWLAALVFGLSVFMVGLATRRYSGSVIAGAAAAALTLGSASLLQVYSWAQTDGLFILLSLAALSLLDLYRNSQHRRPARRPRASHGPRWPWNFAASLSSFGCFMRGEHSPLPPQVKRQPGPGARPPRPGTRGSVPPACPAPGFVVFSVLSQRPRVA